MVRNHGILLHGGARSEKINKSSDRGEKICKSISLASKEGFSLLKRGDAAIDAVEVAVVMMEDSEVFNAGAGSCLTIDGSVEMDASIMSGIDLAAGSVGMVQDISNPIKLARLVMEKSDHVMLVSTGASEFAKLIDMPIKKIHPNVNILERYAKLKKKFNKYWNKNSKMLHDELLELEPHGTVGAVALDRDGNVASAVSTGGRWLKMSGRIGDSAIIGAGIYADNRLGAVCATGNGEFIMKLCLSKYTCDRMKTKNASNCSRQAIKELTNIFGANTGGIIAIDKHGRLGIAQNTHSMPVSFLSNKDERNMTFLSMP
jgi:beta-aspartyl-peptidase (threonine type)